MLPSPADTIISLLICFAVLNVSHGKEESWNNQLFQAICTAQTRSNCVIWHMEARNALEAYIFISKFDLYQTREVERDVGLQDADSYLLPWQSKTNLDKASLDHPL